MRGGVRRSKPRALSAATAAFVEGFSKLNASTTNSSPSASLADSAERMASLTSLLFTRNAEERGGGPNTVPPPAH